MLVNITEHFIEAGHEWQVGQNPDVPREVAAMWIADGKATADTDGARNQSPVSGGGAIGGRKAALLGDSYFANSIFKVGDVMWSNTGANMYFAMSQVLQNPWDLILCAAVSGSDSSGWVSVQLPLITASDADYVFVGYPTNDPGVLTAAQSIANLQTIIEAVVAMDARPVLHTVGNKAAWTSTQRAQAVYVSDWIRYQADTNGYLMIDMQTPSWDPATGAGSTSHYLSEGGIYVHPSQALTIAAARESYWRFADIRGRQINSANAVTQGLYNTAMSGDVSGTPTAWSVYQSGSPTSISRSKVAREGLPAAIARITGTSGAAGDRIGINTANISFTAAWSTGAKALGDRCKGAYGDHWVCTTAGTSSGSQPAAMAAASEIGQTVTDSGGVVWTRYTNIVPGASKLTVIIDFDVHTVSGGDLGAQPVLLANFTGSGLPYSGMRSNVATASTDPRQRLGWTKERRMVLQSPPEILVPATATGMNVYLYMDFSAAGVTATFDIYGIEVRVS